MKKDKTYYDIIFTQLRTAKILVDSDIKILLEQVLNTVDKIIEEHNQELTTKDIECGRRIYDSIYSKEPKYYSWDDGKTIHIVKGEIVDSVEPTNAIMYLTPSAQTIKK